MQLFIILIMKKAAQILSLFILFQTYLKGQTPQNLIGISFVHRSFQYENSNNNNGIGINLERYNSKIKYLSYGLNAEYFGPSRYLNFHQISQQNGFGVNSVTTFKIGMRAALHLQKGKFDFYAGGQLSFVNNGYEYTETRNINTLPHSAYNPYGYGGNQNNNGTFINYRQEKNRSVLFAPFVGLRYYPIRNFGIQIEASQRKTALGLNVKF